MSLLMAITLRHSGFIAPTLKNCFCPKWTGHCIVWLVVPWGDILRLIRDSTKSRDELSSSAICITLSRSLKNKFDDQIIVQSQERPVKPFFAP